MVSNVFIYILHWMQNSLSSSKHNLLKHHPTKLGNKPESNVVFKMADFLSIPYETDKLNYTSF